MTSPSAIVLINGLPLATSGTTGQNVVANSTLQIALANISGVNSWQIDCTESDGLNPLSAYTIIEATKSVNYTNFTATFTMPNTTLIDGYAVGAALQFTSIVNSGQWNEDQITFGIWIMGNLFSRMFFNGENLESNATYGIAPDLNTLNLFLNGAPVPGALNGDVTGATSANTVVAIQNNPILAQSLGVAQDGYFLTWDNTGGNWEALPGAALTTVAMGGDVSGLSNNTSVIKANGATIPVAGSLTTGNVLQVNGISSLSYAAVDLAGGSNFVTGTLPTSNQAAQSLVGDASGTTAANTVIKIQGNAIKAETPGSAQDGYVLTWVNGTNEYEVKPTAAGATLAGDVTGGIGSNTVVKIDGASVPAAGSLTTGNVLQVTGSSALSYSAVDLAGGVNFVTGTLPTGNQDSQSMGGDVSGTTAAATVIKIQTNAVQSGTLGVSQDGYIATWKNSDNQIEFLPNSFSGTVTLAGDVTGASNANTVVKIQGNAVKAETPGASQDGYVLTWVNGTNEFEVKPTSADVDTLVGDVTGDIGSNTVVKIQGNAVKAETPGAAQDGYVLTWVNGTNEYEVKPTAIDVDILAGDVTGNIASNTVVKIQGNAVKAETPGASQDGYVLTWVNGTNEFEVKPIAADVDTLVGDVTGDIGSNTVVKIDGASVPAAGSLTIGNVLQVTGSSALSYSAVDLAGGSNFVTGVLPTGNQANQAMGGDVTGTTAACTVVKIDGTSVPASPAANTVLVATSSTTSVWNKILDGYIDAAAQIAVSKLAPGTSAQILLTDSSTVSTWTTVSGDGSISSTGVLQIDIARGLKSATTTVGVSAATAPSLGQVLTATSSTTATWQSPSSGFTAGGDLSGTSSSQTVIAISGSTPIVITPAELQWKNSTASPLLDQAALASTSGGSGSTGQVLAVTAQTGQAATGSGNTGGIGGALTVSAGTGGSSGSSNGGAGGALNLVAGAAGSGGTPGAVGTVNIKNGASTNLAVAPTTITLSQNTTINATLTANASTLGTTTTKNSLIGSLVLTTRSIAANLVIDTSTTDLIILVDTSAARTITLPVPTNGRTIIIKDKTGSAEGFNIQLLRNASEKIEGIAATRQLGVNWGCWRVISDGVDWFLC